VQETIITVSLAATRSAFLGYSLNSKQAPARRGTEYFRVLDGSKESAKELILFGLSSFLSDLYTKLSDELYAETVTLSRHRVYDGIFFAFLGVIGYYGCHDQLLKTGGSYAEMFELQAASYH
jgi:ATP-binding cassette subfamily B protein